MESKNKTSTSSIVTGIILPLALAQFIASYAASNMNVAITAIASDLNTSVSGVQTAITLFTLTMAALMLPGSKLTDIWGRKRCFQLGLIIYGSGALIAAFSQGLGLLIFGYSLLEGIGSALMIPPIYILLTVSFASLQERAKSFGIVSAAAGVGSAAGPLIGGLITSLVSWRASFIVQVLVVVGIILLGRRIFDPGIEGEKPKFDLFGAVISATGLLFIVLGILQSNTYGWFTSREDFSVGETVLIPQGGISPIWIFIAIGAALLVWFYLHIRSREKNNQEPLIQTRLLKNRISNLGLVTQNVQWLTLQGSFFVISVFLQSIRGFNAIQTGLILTPATIGVLLSSAIAGRLAKRFSQRILIISGFIASISGSTWLLLFASETSSIWNFVPGLFLIGAGVGVMLTSSVNVVQSAFPDKDQGEISGLSRSISNLGSSLGVALAGSVLVGAAGKGNEAFGIALIILNIIGVIGLGAAILIPKAPKKPSENLAKAT